MNLLPDIFEPLKQEYPAEFSHIRNNVFDESIEEMGRVILAIENHEPKPIMPASPEVQHYERKIAEKNAELKQNYITESGLDVSSALQETLNAFSGLETQNPLLDLEQTNA